MYKIENSWPFSSLEYVNVKDFLEYLFKANKREL